MQSFAPAPTPFTYMDVLIDLLGEFPVGQEWRRTEMMTERLDALEYEARWGEASETTLAAIQGARVLLAII
ncbi:hypothetical protein ADL19_05625 [Streptomyces purpurogeneiscleroticus]|nr:hypothetical protein ADL19_05625 [Streptomyces purpurogeneiscleroticus]